MSVDGHGHYNNSNNGETRETPSNNLKRKRNIGTKSSEIKWRYNIGIKYKKLVSKKNKTKRVFNECYNARINVQWIKRRKGKTLI